MKKLNSTEVIKGIEAELANMGIDPTTFDGTFVDNHNGEERPGSLLVIFCNGEPEIVQCIAGARYQCMNAVDTDDSGKFHVTTYSRSGVIYGTTQKSFQDFNKRKEGFGDYPHQIVAEIRAGGEIIPVPGAEIRDCIVEA